MRKAIELFLVALCIFLAPKLAGQTQTVSVLQKNETFISPSDDMVVMDKYTYCHFNYVKEKFDSLRTEISTYDSILINRDTLEKQMRSDYENLLSAKEKEIRDYSDGYASLKTTVETSIKQQDQLELNYKKLEEKNNRTKRWRNIFMGTSAVLTGIVVLLLH